MRNARSLVLSKGTGSESVGRPLAVWASCVILALSIVSCTGDDGAGEAGDDPTSAGSGASELEYVRALAECLEDAGWEILKACLEDMGYSISDPPSIDTFVATHYTEEGWYPYLELPDMENEEEWLRVNEQCPQPEVEGE